MGEVTAITQIDGQNFKILSILKVAGLKEKKLVLLEDGVKEMLEPLIFEGCKKDSKGREVADIIKDFIPSLFNKDPGISDMEFIGENNKKYKVLFHHIETKIYGFLVYPISEEILQELEKRSTAKTYFDGNRSIPITIKNKEELN